MMSKPILAVPSAIFRIPLLFALAMFTLIPASNRAAAQATQGSVVGVVTDAAGAVVPGATVTLTNTSEGTERSVRTNGTGDYQFLDVKAGRYTVAVEAEGFARWTAAGVNLAVRQERRVDA